MPDDPTTERFRAFAVARGWSYDEHGDVDAAYGWPNPVRDRPCSDLMCGAFDGREAVVSGGGPERGGNRTVALRMPASLPWLFVDPLRIHADQIHFLAGRYFGTFETESEDFNRRFHVRTEHPELAAYVLGPRVIDRILAHESSFPLRIEDRYVSTWGMDVALQDIGGRLEELALFLDDMPTLVWERTEAWTRRI